MDEPGHRDRRGTWLVEWREAIPGDGVRPQPFMLCAEQASGLEGVRRCVGRVGGRAWLGEFRLTPRGGRPIYSDFLRIQAWREGLPLGRVHSPWAGEVRRRVAARRLREELRDSVDRALAAQAIDEAGAVMVVEMGSALTEAVLNPARPGPSPAALPAP